MTEEEIAALLADRARLEQENAALRTSRAAVATEATRLRHALVELISACSQVQIVWRLGALNEMAVALAHASDATCAAEQAVGLARPEGGN